MLEIESALSRWHDFGIGNSAAPRCIRELGGGLTNRSYLVAAGDRHWVLRLNSEHDERYGIDRERERHILEKVVDAGLAPEVAYCAPDYSLLLSEWVDGRHLPDPPDARGPMLARLRALVRKIHAVEVDLPVEDYYRHAERYWQILTRSGIRLPDELHAARRTIAEERELAFGSDRTACLCHRDLNPGNIIECEGELVVLDWEYAAKGWPPIDYATICVDWNLPLEIGSAAFELDPAVLRHAIRLYRYTCALWYLLQRSSRP